MLHHAHAVVGVSGDLAGCSSGVRPHLMVAAIRERDWEGDDVLANQFGSFAGKQRDARSPPAA